MKVTELRKLLEEMEAEGHGDKDVMYSYNSGDYWRTQVAAKISLCEEGFVQLSEYHSMDKVVDYEDGNRNPDDRQVIILS